MIYDVQYAEVDLVDAFVGGHCQRCAGGDVIVHEVGVVQVGEDVTVHEEEVIGQLIQDHQCGPDGAER